VVLRLAEALSADPYPLWVAAPGRRRVLLSVDGEDVAEVAAPFALRVPVLWPGRRY